MHYDVLVEREPKRSQVNAWLESHVTRGNSGEDVVEVNAVQVLLPCVDRVQADRTGCGDVDDITVHPTRLTI